MSLLPKGWHLTYIDANVQKTIGPVKLKKIHKMWHRKQIGPENFVYHPKVLGGTWFAISTHEQLLAKLKSAVVSSISSKSEMKKFAAPVLTLPPPPEDEEVVIAAPASLPPPPAEEKPVVVPAPAAVSLPPPPAAEEPPAVSLPPPPEPVVVSAPAVSLPPPPEPEPEPEPVVVSAPAVSLPPPPAAEESPAVSLPPPPAAEEEPVVEDEKLELPTPPGPPAVKKAPPGPPAVKKAPPGPPAVKKAPPGPPAVKKAPPGPPAVKKAPPGPPAVKKAPPGPPAVKKAPPGPPAVPDEPEMDDLSDVELPEPPVAVPEVVADTPVVEPVEVDATPVSLAAEGDIIMQGPLQKERGKMATSWHTFYCVLKPTVLLFFNTKTEFTNGVEPHNAVPLAGAICSTSIPKRIKTKRVFALIPQGPPRTYYLAAENAEAYTQWTKMVQDCAEGGDVDANTVRLQTKSSGKIASHIHSKEGDQPDDIKMSDSIMSLYMSKLGGGRLRAIWQERFFCVVPPFLVYATNEVEMKRGELTGSIPLKGCVVEKSAKYPNKNVMSLRWKNSLVSAKVYHFKIKQADLFDQMLMVLKKTIRNANGETGEEEAKLELAGLTPEVIAKTFKEKMSLLSVDENFYYKDLVPAHFQSMVNRQEQGDWAVKRVGKLLKVIIPNQIKSNAEMLTVIQREAEKFRTGGHNTAPELIEMYSKLYSFLESQSTSSAEQYAHMDVLVDRMLTIHKFGEDQLPGFVRKENTVTKAMYQSHTAFLVSERKGLKHLARHRGENSGGMKSMFKSKDKLREKAATSAETFQTQVTETERDRKTYETQTWPEVLKNMQTLDVTRLDAIRAMLVDFAKLQTKRLDTQKEHLHELIKFVESSNDKDHLEDFVENLVNKEGNISPFRDYIYTLPVTALKIRNDQLSTQSSSLFGNSIGRVMEIEKANNRFAANMPAIVHTLIGLIESNQGFMTENIFRNSSPDHEVIDLQNLLECGAEDVKVSSPHVPASLFKKWLLLLDDALIPEEHYLAAIKLAKDEKSTASDFEALIVELPEPNKNTIQAIADMCRVISAPENKAINKMNIVNLGIVFSRFMLRNPSTDQSNLISNTPWESQFTIKVLLALAPPDDNTLLGEEQD